MNDNPIVIFHVMTENVDGYCEEGHFRFLADSEGSGADVERLYEEQQANGTNGRGYAIHRLEFDDVSDLVEWFNSYYVEYDYEQFYVKKT